MPQMVTRPGRLPLPSRFGARSLPGRFAVPRRPAGARPALVHSAAMPGASLPPLLPRPRDATRDEGHFRLAPGLPIVLGPGTTHRDLVTARSLRAGLLEHARFGALERVLPVEVHGSTRGLGPVIELRHDGHEGIAGDVYRIRVTPERAEVEAGGPAGLRWGCETLAQLLDGRDRLPACHIEDRPDFEFRGVMLDVSRGKVPTWETLCEVVDVLARLKLNVLMLYTEHTFAFRRHPEIAEGSSPLDAETMLALDTYAAERFVQLVPCLQSLGHMERILSLPAYAHLAETDLGWTAAPAEPGTTELLEALYAEYLPLFRSRLFNANCDEPWDLARGKSKAREEQLGGGGVYLEHVRRIRDLAKAQGKRTLIWGDVVHAHPERIPEIDRDLVLLDWWYEADFDFDRVKVFADNGLEFWVCPGTSSWNSLFPRVENSRVNIARWADAGRRHGARGLLVTDWGDFGHYNLQGNSWLGYAWAAQQAWSGECEHKEFDRAFGRRLFGETRGEVARLYRALGEVHDPGFRTFNGSPLQYLYFDELQDAYFLGATRQAALGRCEQRLERVLQRIEGAEAAFGADRRTFEELCYAARASLLAVRKATAALEYLSWRERPQSWKAGERRRLADRLRELAEIQAGLGRTFEKLWLARSRPSDLAMTKRRLQHSIRSLRAAARHLATSRPPPPAERREVDPRGTIAALRRSVS